MGGVEAAEQPLAASDDRSTIIIRGKRTKRPRTPSSCGGGAVAASSSSVSVDGCGSGDYDLCPASSSGATVFQSTEEEEDLAYCLILLAQGPRRLTDEDVDAKLGSVELFRSSKKFSEVATAGSAVTKAGFYMYECKTCCRTFPSFQALGGHRASHKKPRLAEETKKSPSEPHSDEDEEEGQIRKITVGPPACSSPNFPGKVLQPSKPKIHECSICGLEFSSGQALGGHMRRHRAAAAPATSSCHVATSLGSMTTEHRHDSDMVREDGSRGVILSLDLNLPAPEEDRKFQFAAAPAQKPLMFSAPALVDCHY